jgi:hypothetical protein
MDITAALLWKIDLTLLEAQEVISHAKRIALQPFPDKEATFALIYIPCFHRILSEMYQLH